MPLSSHSLRRRNEKGRREKRERRRKRSTTRKTPLGPAPAPRLFLTHLTSSTNSRTLKLFNRLIDYIKLGSHFDNSVCVILFFNIINSINNTVQIELTKIMNQDTLKCNPCSLAVLMKYPGSGALMTRGFPVDARYPGITISLA